MFGWRKKFTNFHDFTRRETTKEDNQQFYFRSIIKVVLKVWIFYKKEQMM